MFLHCSSPLIDLNQRYRDRNIHIFTLVSGRVKMTKSKKQQGSKNGSLQNGAGGSKDHLLLHLTTGNSLDVNSDIQEIDAIDIIDPKKALDYEYQRIFRWKDENIQRYLRSFLSGAKMDPITLYSTNKNISSHKEGPWKIIDGKQRITSLRLFLGNKYKVQVGDEELSFSDLSSMNQERIKRRGVSVRILYSISGSSDRDIHLYFLGIQNRMLMAPGDAICAVRDNYTVASQAISLLNEAHSIAKDIRTCFLPESMIEKYHVDEEIDLLPHICVFLSYAYNDLQVGDDYPLPSIETAVDGKNWFQREQYQISEKDTKIILKLRNIFLSKVKEWAITPIALPLMVPILCDLFKGKGENTQTSDSKSYQMCMFMTAKGNKCSFKGKYILEDTDTKKLYHACGQHKRHKLNGGFKIIS